MSPQPLRFPVSKKQREEMKKGNELLQHYHDVLFEGDTIAVVVGLPFDRKKYEYLFPRGIDIIPIVLTEEQIDSLKEKMLIHRSVGPSGIPVETHVIDTEAFKKWQERKRLKPSG